MANVVAHRVLWSLNTNQILGVSCAALKLEPVIAFIALLLVTLAKVPTQDKVLRDVVHAPPNEPHANIVPWHPPILGLGELVRLPVVDGVEVHDPVVVEILAWKNFILSTRRVHVGKGVLVVVPTAEAEVETSDECHGVIYNNKLLVVSLFWESLVSRKFTTRMSSWQSTNPIKCHVARMLENIVVRMSHDSDITMAF